MFQDATSNKQSRTLLTIVMLTANSVLIAAVSCIERAGYQLVAATATAAAAAGAGAGPGGAGVVFVLLELRVVVVAAAAAAAAAAA